MKTKCATTKTATTKNTILGADSDVMAGGDKVRSGEPLVTHGLGAGKTGLCRLMQ